MSFDLELDDDLVQRLEHRYRRAQNVLAGARANYGSLREVRGVSEIQLQQALRRVERAQQELADIESAIERVEQQTGFT
jgi:chromosome segregation ATPase